MFSGIIEAVGTIRDIEQLQGDCRFTVNTGNLDRADLKKGDSIAMNGVCLTVVEPGDAFFTTDISRETLSVTSLGNLQGGSRVNLERAMQVSDRFHGHLVTGHVDAAGTVISVKQDGRSQCFAIRFPQSLQKYICKKGSICVDGVSLTVNEVRDSVMSINIIPHTLSKTIFSDYIEGTTVNIEIDIIARYLESIVNPA